MKGRKLNNNDFKEWYKKYSYLIRIINELEKKKESGYLISSFILHAQLIEYRLKKELNLINHFINDHIKDLDLKIITKSVEQIEEEKLTLGSLIRELDRYEGELLKDLKSKLKQLLKYRNIINHKLFNFGSLVEAEKIAAKGNELAHAVWGELERISYFTSNEYYYDKFADELS